MRLFRRKDSDEKRRVGAPGGTPDVDVSVIDLTTAVEREIEEIGVVVDAANGELDLIENRLTELRQQGEQLVDLDAASALKQPGSVEMLDLSALMSLSDEDDDDEFGQRFKEFANADEDGASDRGWLDHS